MAEGVLGPTPGYESRGTAACSARIQPSEAQSLKIAVTSYQVYKSGEAHYGFACGIASAGQVE
jgi:hypothetical protein